MPQSFCCHLLQVLLEVYEEIMVARRFHRAVQYALLHLFLDRFVHLLPIFREPDLGTDSFSPTTLGSVYLADGMVLHPRRVTEPYRINHWRGPSLTPSGTLNSSLIRGARVAIVLTVVRITPWHKGRSCDVRNFHFRYPFCAVLTFCP